MEDFNYKELLEYFLHEVIQLNANIKSHSELLSKGLNDKNGVAHHSEIINENATILSVLIDIVNYRLNPELFNSMEKDFRNLHGKFHKVLLSLKSQLKHKNIKANISCEVEKRIELLPIIDTLPYLLLDNAIKYSHKDGHIHIQIIELGTIVQIEVKNYGPKIFEEERKKLFERGFRGENAVNMHIRGSGLGLNFIKYICDLHNGKVSVEFGENEYVLNNIDYQLFKIKIELPK